LGECRGEREKKSPAGGEGDGQGGGERIDVGAKTVTRDIGKEGGLIQSPVVTGQGKGGSPSFCPNQKKRIGVPT